MMTAEGVSNVAADWELLALRQAVLFPTVTWLW